MLIKAQQMLTKRSINAQKMLRKSSENTQQMLNNGWQYTAINIRKALDTTAWNSTAIKAKDAPSFIWS